LSDKSVNIKDVIYNDLNSCSGNQRTEKIANILANHTTILDIMLNHMPEVKAVIEKMINESSLDVH
jgi:hypothetical protein